MRPKLAETGWFSRNRTSTFAEADHLLHLQLSQLQPGGGSLEQLPDETGDIHCQSVWSTSIIVRIVMMVEIVRQVFLCLIFGNMISLSRRSIRTRKLIQKQLCQKIWKILVMITLPTFTQTLIQLLNYLLMKMMTEFLDKPISITRFYNPNHAC